MSNIFGTILVYPELTSFFSSEIIFSYLCIHIKCCKLCPDDLEYVDFYLFRNVKLLLSKIDLEYVSRTGTVS